MANATTEHSRKLRAKTANEWARKRLDSGELKQINLRLPKKTAEMFDSLCEKLELSRPQALKILIEHYNAK
ncbi:ribbon-helix-helix protein, CopG family [Actinobacillus porcinus]|uniref:ribbon-helix-helix protein, CopG family n=1 Tax=Actinobacillus porcinus TaxID=51048 RepID=UPI002A91582B|nr:ribbon-helix-helix protein, CopG family [Actinobacillus porcinus]MDY6216656.1 ribbon-helix-helix protein, CopG family [Actinobacillus porcinus]